MNSIIKALFFLAFIGTANAAPSSKVVIFWASYGGGHKSAALAIKAEIEKVDPSIEVELKDLLDFLPPARKAKNLEFYEKQVSKHPELFDLAFRINMSVGARLEPYYLPSNLQYDSKKIAAYLREKNPALILSTFNQATEVLTRMRYDGRLNPEVKIGWQHTDFVDGKRFANLSRRIDMTFLPHAGLKTSWTELYGVPESQVLATGIAVNPKMAETLSPAERAAFLESKALRPEVRTIVLMSGVNAVGDFPKIIRSIAAASNGPIQIVAICGKNPDQLAAIRGLKLPGNAILKAEGYTAADDVALYFKSADAIVTKAGGLSSAELFTIGKPAVFLDINGGQERYNIRYFERRKIAVSVRDQTKVGDAVNAAIDGANRDGNLAVRQREFLDEKDSKTAGQWAAEQVAALRTNFPDGVSVLLPNRPNGFVRCRKLVEEAFDVDI